MEKGSSALQIPDSIMESVKLTMANLEQVNTQLLDFVSTADSQLLADMPPLQRAQALLMLAKATTVIFTLRVRCSGVNPEDHPVKSELERMSVYQDKLERFIHLTPLRPSTTLNAQAATRVIGHSLPGLSPAQRQSIREISRGKRLAVTVSGKKRKYEASGKQSVQTAAKEFLEKAARELLGDDDGAVKGPVQMDDDAE